MKKFIVSITLLAITGIGFIGCGDDDGNGNCKICEDGGFKAEACDNGDGTGTFTISSEDGEELFSVTDDLEEGENINDLDCNDFDISDFIVDFEEEEEEGDSMSANECYTCSVTTGQAIPIVYCDNGDGTISATVATQTVTQDLQGVDFSLFISTLQSTSDISCTQN